MFTLMIFSRYSSVCTPHMFNRLLANHKILALNYLCLSYVAHLISSKLILIVPIYLLTTAYFLKLQF